MVALWSLPANCIMSESAKLAAWFSKRQATQYSIRTFLSIYFTPVNQTEL